MPRTDKDPREAKMLEEEDRKRVLERRRQEIRDLLADSGQTRGKLPSGWEKNETLCNLLDEIRALRIRIEQHSDQLISKRMKDVIGQWGDAVRDRRSLALKLLAEPVVVPE